MILYFYSHFKKMFINVQRGFLTVLLLIACGCSGHEKSEQERLRAQNAKGEYIYRNHNEKQYPLPSPIHRDREPYPWEELTDH